MGNSHHFFVLSTINWFENLLYCRPVFFTTQNHSMKHSIKHTNLQLFLANEKGEKTANGSSFNNAPKFFLVEGNRENDIRESTLTKLTLLRPINYKQCHSKASKSSFLRQQWAKKPIKTDNRTTITFKYPMQAASKRCFFLRITGILWTQCSHHFWSSKSRKAECFFE